MISAPEIEGLTPGLRTPGSGVAENSVGTSTSITVASGGASVYIYIYKLATAQYGGDYSEV